MLKSMLLINNNIDISKFAKLVQYLKRQNDNYIAKKSKTLSQEDVKKFLSEADETYLLIKVALVFALHGCCRCAELCHLLCTDIVDTGSIAVVTLSNTKNKKQRTFTVTSECNSYNFFKKYYALRPTNATNGRFFLFYSKGKCTCQPVEIQSFSQMSKKIAEFLQLPDSNLYTGHCMRRTSATLLADSGANISMLKRHGGWKSASIAEGYVDDSMQNKIKMSKRIFQEDGQDKFAQILHEIDTNIKTPGILNFTNMNNCCIHVSDVNINTK